MDKKTRRMKNIKKAARIGANTVEWSVGGALRLSVRAVATVLLIVLTTGLLFTCVFAYYVKETLNSEVGVKLEEIRGDVALTSEIKYRDAAGNWQTLQMLYSTVNTVWVESGNIPPYMKQAAVAIEDKRFYEHKGVDWYRTAGAFANMFLSMKNDFGGSTLTQQLIKNITKKDDITVQRKLLEIFNALDFERLYSKDQILEWYLNSIFLGNRCYGVGTAAQTYFGKEVWELSLAECAAIVGITNNPSRYDPFVSESNNKERQETILDEMYSQGYITKAECDAAKAEKLVFTRSEDEGYVEEVRSYYVDNIIRDVIRDLMEEKDLDENVATRLVYSGGYTIYACIDMEIQNIVDSYYRDWSLMPQGYGATQPLQSAMVILDQYTGDIVAIAGGIGEKTGNFLHDRATIAKRSPGSSFKPIATYGPAMDLGLITQTTLVNDAANIVLKGSPNWYPKNSGGGNSGVVDIRSALRSSLNTVSAQILDILGPTESYNYLTRKLGVTSLMNPNDIDYAPLSLGQLTNGITVREMAQAYGALANDGLFRKGRTYSMVKDRYGTVVIDNTSEPIEAFKPNTAWNMTDMLVNAVNAGTGTEARLPNMPVAGKTGTTSDDWDRYFCGYTPYYVAAVWTGYDMPERMQFGMSNPAAAIWRMIMGEIHENLEYRTFPVPTIGAPTNIFGSSLTTKDDEKDDDDDEKPSPSPSPTPETSPSPSPDTSTPPSTTPPPTTPPPTTPPPTTPPPTTPPPSAPPEENTPPPPPTESLLELVTG